MNSGLNETGASTAGAGRSPLWAACLLALLLTPPLIPVPLLAPALAQEGEPEASPAAQPAESAEQAEATGETTDPPEAPESSETLESPAPPQDAGADREELRDEILDRYQALPARDGVLLVPRENVPGISSIEIADGEVVVNGEPVADTILRSWLGDEAEPLLALAVLEAEAARELLEVDATGGAEALPVTASADDEERETARRGGDDEGEERRAIRRGNQLKVGGDVIVEEDEVVTEAMAIGGSVVVRGRVLNDVVAIGGRVEVEGEVGGELVGLMGGVFLGPDSRVDGNITAIGSGVRRAPGSSVGGGVTEVAVPGVGGPMDWQEWMERRRYRGDDFLRQWQTNEAYWNLVGSVLLALLACLALLIARGPVERVERRIAVGSEFLGAGVVGILVQLLIVPILAIVSFFLIITIVGCLALPLIPFVILALLVAALFGYAGVALRVGRWLENRFGWSLTSPYAALLLGVALIEVWKLVGEILDIFGGPAWAFAAMFLFAGVLVEYVAWSVGLGAILMNWMQGRRDRRLPPPPPPAATSPRGPYAGGGGDPYAASVAEPRHQPAVEPRAEAPPAAPAGEPATPPERPAGDREPGDEPAR